MTTFKDIVALLAILACYGIAGHFDEEDALRAEAQSLALASSRSNCDPAVVDPRHAASDVDAGRTTGTSRDSVCRPLSP